MLSVPVFDAKARLSELLLQVQAGEEITITKHGRPMARLVPATAPTAARKDAARRRSVDAAFAALAILREGVTLDVPLRQAIEDGRD
jgi:prevent-host-death family protein